MKWQAKNSVLAVLYWLAFIGLAQAHTVESLDPRGHETQRVPAKPLSKLHFVRHARYQLTAGQPQRIAVSIQSSTAVTGVHLEAHTDAGLMLTQSATHYRSTLTPGETYTVFFDVVAQHDGRHYLTVLASASVDGHDTLSVYAVPVTVGAEQLTDAAAAPKKRSHDTADGVTEAQGERLILLPARSSLGR
ncbi:MAG: hypothetical protein AAF465_06455 [Pseudomonadota bacterium]